MTSKFKPYRLINDLELNAFQQAFERKLQAWNDEYAVFPLSCTFSRKHSNKSEPRPLNDLSLIKHSLFGDQSDCFNIPSETLFATLLTQLFGTQPWALDTDDAPLLTLNLQNASGCISLHLHPEWVLNHLPAYDAPKTPPIALHDALAPQTIPLHVVLNPLPLKLADVMRLQVGDVIKTDQLITEPLTLAHKKNSICNVDIGKSTSYKSIQITRTS